MTKVLKKEIGSLIRQARINQNLTQKLLAKQCLISRNYISDIESGRYAPSVETLIKISNNIGLDLNLFKNVVNTLT